MKLCPTNFSLSLEFGHFSPRSGRECVAQGKSAQPWVSMRLLTVSPRSGRQKKLQIRDVRAAAAARCAGLAANVPTSPGLRRLALGYTLHQLRWWATNFSLSIFRSSTNFRTKRQTEVCRTYEGEWTMKPGRNFAN